MKIIGMNTNIFKITAVLLILSGCLSSCRKKGENVNEDCLSFIKYINSIVHDESSSILGKWKLEKEIGIRMGNSDTPYLCDDYTQSNIIFEFKANNVLTITADTDFYLKGEHSHSIIENDEWWGKQLYLKIGHTNWFFGKSSNELVLNLMPLDGPAYYLVKIN
jgi:predicted nucleotide-binding protein (sugar kinase/HSP70/actin superfamily)